MDGIFEADINYLAVLAATVAAQPLGFLWYGPLFGGLWMKARGYTKRQVEADYSPLSYVIPVIASAGIAYGIARLVDMVGADGMGECVLVACFVWASFVAMATMMQVNFSPGTKDKVTTFGIEAGFYLAMFAITGVIVGAFQ